MIEDNVILTEDQEKALQALSDWWALSADHPDYYNCIFAAPAGCGKTFLAKHFTKQMKNAYPLFTATTNEAVRQLELAGVEAVTTHSALGLVPCTSQEQMKFIQKELPEAIQGCNLLIVDEASMASHASEAEEKLIINYVLELGIRTLWLGDTYQLPPIESDNGISPIFSLGFLEVNLTKVVRNKGDILTLCTELRKAIDAPVKRVPRLPAGVFQITLGQFYKYLQRESTQENFKSGKSICIVWRNSTADAINAIVRNNLYGKDLASQEEYLPGDQILFTAPLMVGAFPENPEYLVNNKQVKVGASVNTRAEIIKVNKDLLYNIPVYKCEIRIEGGQQANVYISTKQGKVNLNSVRAQIVKQAAEQKGYAKAATWQKWHAFNSIFAKVKNSYCITTHRSQGSTIPNVIVNANDILIGARSHKLLTFKMLYTAVSRASQSLTIIKD